MLKRLVIPGGKRTFFMLLLVVALLSGSIFAYNYFDSQNKQAQSSPATQKAGSIEPGPVSTEVDAEKANTAPKEREGEDESANIADYFKFRFDQMKDSSGKIPDGALMKAINQRTALQKNAPLGSNVAGINNASWTAAGPGNVGGRIRTILPLNSTTVLIGSVAGGLWKTSNCCSTSTTWSPVNDFMTNLAISSLIMDPTNANTLYAGTGEGVYNFDAVRGAGVFKSIDGGATWAQLSSTNNGNWNYVNRLSISPNGSTLLAVTSNGIYRSTSGGSSWTQVLSDYDLKDVQFNPSDNQKAVASGNALKTYYSTNGGSTWNAASGLPSGGDWLARIEIAYAPSNPAIVYAGVNNNNGEVWKSTDGGQSYALVNTGTSYLSGQGWYDNMIWVDPTNASHLVVGGLDIYKSTDGGAHLTQISEWWNSWGYVNPPSPHADHHVMVSMPAGSSTGVLSGNDGGLYYTSNINTAGTNSNYNSGWVYLNNTLAITQFYGASGNSNGVLYAGSQDNGTLRSAGGAGAANSWIYSDGGDGGKTAVDPTDPNYFYGEYVDATVYRSSDAGLSNTSIYDTSGCSLTDAGNNAAFISPLLIDPNNSNTLYVGALRLWKSTNVKAASPCWSIVKPAIVSSDVITSIAVAPGNSNIIWVGYGNGEIDMTTNGGSSWSQVDTNIGANNPGTQVDTIAIDQNDNNVVYVGFTGFGSNRAWRTSTGGASWTDITSNLPDFPIYAFAINPSSSAWLYVGTEGGIFASTDTGGSWNVTSGAANGDGPANVATFDLEWMGGGNSTGSNTLIAATHGRGVFTADTNPPAVTNDDFAYANTLHSAPYTTNESTLSMTSAIDDPTIPDCNLAAGTATVWYKYTPATDTSFALDTLGSDYDTFIAVWTGSRGSLTKVTCNDDLDPAVGLIQSQVVVDMSAGTTYYFEIGQFSGYLSSPARLQPESNSGSTHKGQRLSNSAVPKQPAVNINSASGGNLVINVVALANTNVSVNASSASANIAPYWFWYFNFPSLIDGPAHVTSTDGNPIFTSQRATSGESYNEVMGIPTSQLTTNYWFPAYDHSYIPSTNTNPMRMWVLVGNASTTQSATVNITIGGVLTADSPFSIPPSGRITPRWIGSKGGPVHVVSTNGVKIFTSERVFTYPTSSFNEILGFPANQLTSEYWFPYYDSTNMSNAIQVSNTSSSQAAAVDIYIGTGTPKRGSYSIPANGTITQSYAGVVDGPVRVVSTNSVKVVTSQITLSGPNNAFNEVLGYPFNQFTTEYWYPTYNHSYIPGTNTDLMRMWVLVGNPSTTLTATVDIYMGGGKITGSPFSIAPGGRVTPRWIGINDGPVRVVSTNGVPIFTSERVLTFPNSVFNEMMGFPRNQMSTEYWFPYYDSINMSNDILVSRP